MGLGQPASMLPKISPLFPKGNHVLGISGRIWLVAEQRSPGVALRDDGLHFATALRLSGRGKSPGLRPFRELLPCLSLRSSTTSYPALEDRVARRTSGPRTETESTRYGTRLTEITRLTGGCSFCRDHPTAGRSQLHQAADPGEVPACRQPASVAHTQVARIAKAIHSLPVPPEPSS